MCVFVHVYTTGVGERLIGFGPDWIRTLVSMATEISRRVVMVKIL